MEEKQWITKINQELNELPDDLAESEWWRKHSIYKIPASITDLNERAYKPQIVSIGPYHHSAEHLKAMEKHKRRALLHFLKRSNERLETLVEALTLVVDDVKAAYDQLDSEWYQDTDKFLEMMILDGCFILEILQTVKRRQNEDTSVYAVNDPIFSYHGQLYVFQNLRYDMLMLENQIPMLVLEKLASVQKKRALVQNEDPFHKDHGLTTLILNFFSQGKAGKHVDHFQRCLHILDVHRRSLVIEAPARRSRRKMGQRIRHSARIFRSVREFKEAGIRIIPSKTRSLQDIRFQHGVLKLPPIVVDDALESLFLNLMAFERFHVGAGNEVASYVYFMNNIIANEMDVSLLASCGIIENVLGSDMAVANLFKSLSREAIYDPDNSLDEVHEQVSSYCGTPLRIWRADIRRNYITTRYAVASVAATSFVIALTIAQTAFSVMSYVKQSPNG